MRFLLQFNYEWISAHTHTRAHSQEYIVFALQKVRLPEAAPNTFLHHLLSVRDRNTQVTSLERERTLSLEDTFPPM